MNAHAYVCNFEPPCTVAHNTQRMPPGMGYLFHETRRTLDAGQKMSNKRSQSHAKTSKQMCALIFIDVNLFPNNNGIGSK